MDGFGDLQHKSGSEADGRAGRVHDEDLAVCLAPAATPPFWRVIEPAMTPVVLVNG
jgi:hypothetical protein